MTAEGQSPRRRTQAERTAATRDALLDATIAGLIEVGYSGVTTADISARAGVSRGALTHHFAGKAELVTEAVRHLAHKLVSDSRPPLRHGDDERRSIEAMLDLLWQMHGGELFAAASELEVASRTDEELREAMRSLQDEILATAIAACAEVVPRVAGRSATLQLLSTTTATMRGLAMLMFVRDDISREWRAARRHLLELWTDHLERG